MIGKTDAAVDSLSKVAVALAILKANWDYARKDYLENFVPFLANLICFHKYEQIVVKKICEDFTAMYGLIVPYHPMMSLLRRAKTRGLIKKIGGKVHVPVMERARELEFSFESEKRIRVHEAVLDEIVGFCKTHFQIELTKNEADEAFISFLKDQDARILFAAEDRTILPEVRRSKTKKFLINYFTNWAYKNNAVIFEYIKSIALGHILASAILYGNLAEVTGNLKGVSIYLDTGIVLSLLGAGGGERRLAAEEFVGLLRKAGATLFAFAHTMDEVDRILESARKIIRKDFFDPARASKTALFFYDENLSEADIDQFMVRIPFILSEQKISKVESPDFSTDQAHQIAETNLEKIIIDNYKRGDPAFDELKRSETISKDIKSINCIYKLRKGRKAQRISEVSHVFVTANAALAHASKQYESSVEVAVSAKEQPRFYIPACLTDVLLGTILWLQSPIDASNINEKRMIADCYVALQPDAALLKRYQQELDKLKGIGRISEQEYLALKMTRGARNLLEEKTLGDENRFVEHTPLEVLEDLKRKLEGENLTKLAQKEEEKVKLNEELRREVEATTTLKNRMNCLSERLAVLIANSIFYPLFFLVILGTVLLIWQFPMDGKSLIFLIVKWLSIATALIFSILNYKNGCHFDSLRDKLKKYLSVLFLRWISGEKK